MLKDVILSLVTTPELSTYNLENDVVSYYNNLLSDFEIEVIEETERPITLYLGETGIEIIIPFLMMQSFINSAPPISANYWNHNGLKHNSKLVLPLWTSLPNSITSVGVWEIYNNTDKVAEVVQNPSYDDEVFCMFILNNPKNWISRYNPNGDFTESISPFVGYVRFYTDVEEEIETILLKLSIVGLHAFKPRENWSHTIDHGCSHIEDSPHVVMIGIPKDFSMERSRMFRFATIADDPFDAILRYWHVVENMFDNLVEFILTDFVTVSPRPDKFSRNVSRNITEASCAEKIFENRLSTTLYNEIKRFVDLNGFKPIIEATAEIVGSAEYKFWDKNEKNGLRMLGNLLYSFRNAVAHRKETESWFDRLSLSHENTAKKIIPLIQLLVYYAVVNE